MTALIMAMKPVPLPTRGRGTRLWYALALAMLAPAALSGCGGGGGGGQSAAPPVTATPSPSTTPSPAPASLVPPAPFSLTSSQVFAPLGWIRPTAAGEPVLIGEGAVAFSWSQALGTYEMTLPDVGSGRLNYSFPGNNLSAFSLVGGAGQALTNGITLHDGRFFDPPMRNTGSLIWLRGTGKPGPEMVTFAFGMRTPAANIPTSERRKYLTFEERSGNTLLDIDFGARTIGGYFGLAWVDDWGPYTATRFALTSVTFAADGRSFSARFIIPDAPSEGELHGQFFGQGAGEIAVAYKAPVRNIYDNKWELTFGVRVGTICGGC